MKQHEAVERVMQENGGYATLGYLYQAALKVLGKGADRDIRIVEGAA